MTRYEYYASSAGRLLQLAAMLNDDSFDYCDRAFYRAHQDEEGLCTGAQCDECLKKWLMEEMPEGLPMETVIQRLEQIQDNCWLSYLMLQADVNSELSKDLQLDYKALTQAISWLKGGEPTCNRS